ncbi:hypothetical protein F5Y17DRAFT_389999 [Xylariaceae sp. FL0594]|nr:hypothetical protein F5Y17DRAFT_389999 [Xylariaceae sp. FL0594]
MRTTVACERRSKVKCHHSGEQPCRGCLRSGNAETCVLRPTTVQRVGVATHPRKRPARCTSPSVSASPRVTSTERKRDASSSFSSTGIGDLVQVFAAVDAAVFARAVNIFRTRFPECGFRHAPDLEKVSDGISGVGRLRLIAILAVSSRCIGETDVARRAEHVALLTKELHSRLTSPPSLCLIQCFLIMAIYEWGENSGYNAWMYAGIAARMALAYRATKAGTNEPDWKSTSAILSEVEIRTLWTAFAIDKVMSCGKQRPAIMKAEDIDVRLPQSEEDFIFGTEPQALLRYEDLVSDKSLRRHGFSSGSHFCILVRGLDIWHQIHSWIVDGGRKLPHMTESDNCPWKPTSQWAKLKGQLRAWREDVDPRLRYPETKVAAHVHFGQGEAFAYINLLYYLGTAFLCREFKPFLPIMEREPRGPIDPPFFCEEAPPDWWRQNSDELFDAVAKISHIMRDLNDLGTPLYTPFSGLCVFTAAVMNDYVVAFPAMHRAEETRLRRQLAAENQADLERIAKLWKLGEKWLDVFVATRNLYDRVLNSRSQPVRSSRYDYVEFENSIQCAPIRGLEGDGSKISATTMTTTTTSAATLGSSQVSSASSRKRSKQVAQPEEGHQSQAQPPAYAATEPIVNDPTADEFGGDDWRLWSFWDDPYLPSFDASSMGI